MFAYCTNYLIDNKLGVIVDAEGTRANRIEENRVAVSMVERVIRRFNLKPKRLAANTAGEPAPDMIRGRCPNPEAFGGPWYRAAYPGLGQKHPPGRSVLPRQLSLR